MPMDPKHRLALERAFKDPEYGKDLAELFTSVVMERGPFELSALQFHNGRRSFAIELLEAAPGPMFRPLPEKQDPTRGRMPGRRIGPENVKDAEAD